MRAVADEVNALGRNATAFKADVSKRDDVYAAIDHAEKELGGFDIMVNNAGIAQIKPLAEVMPEEFEKIIRIKGQTYKGTETSRASLGRFVADVVKNPAPYLGEDLGITQSETDGDKPAAYR